MERQKIGTLLCTSIIRGNDELQTEITPSPHSVITSIRLTIDPIVLRVKLPTKRLRVGVNMDQKRHVVLREQVFLDLFHAVRQLREGFPLQTLVYLRRTIGTYRRNCRSKRWPCSSPCPDPFWRPVSASAGSCRDCNTHSECPAGTSARSSPAAAPIL